MRRSRVTRGITQTASRTSCGGVLATSSPTSAKQRDNLIQSVRLGDPWRSPYLATLLCGSATTTTRPWAWSPRRLVILAADLGEHHSRLADPVVSAEYGGDAVGPKNLRQPASRWRALLASRRDGAMPIAGPTRQPSRYIVRVTFKVEASRGRFPPTRRSRSGSARLRPDAPSRLRTPPEG